MERTLCGQHQWLLQSIREIARIENERDSITTYRLLYVVRAQRYMHVIGGGGGVIHGEDVAAAMEKLKAQRPPDEPVLEANGFVAGGSFVAGVLLLLRMMTSIQTACHR
jgi:hypothetical protein